MVGLTFDFVCLLASYSLLVWSGPTTRDQFNFTEKTKYLVIGFSAPGRLIDFVPHSSCCATLRFFAAGASVKISIRVNTIYLNYQFSVIGFLL